MKQLTDSQLKKLMHAINIYGEHYDTAKSLTNQELGDKVLQIWAENIGDEKDPYLFELLERLGWKNLE